MSGESPDHWENEGRQKGTQVRMVLYPSGQVNLAEISKFSFTLLPIKLFDKSLFANTSSDRT